MEKALRRLAADIAVERRLAASNLRAAALVR
jgi:hypothetical protein